MLPRVEFRRAPVVLLFQDTSRWGIIVGKPLNSSKGLKRPQMSTKCLQMLSNALKCSQMLSRPLSWPLGGPPRLIWKTSPIRLSRGPSFRYGKLALKPSLGFRPATRMPARLRMSRLRVRVQLRRLIPRPAGRPLKPSRTVTTPNAPTPRLRRPQFQSPKLQAWPRRPLQ